MASNPYANKVEVNGNTIIDLTADTAIASDVASGKYFHLATGERVQGTASGGGSSSWTKVAEKEITLSNFVTTGATNIETWETGHSELWTSDKILYVRIRDKAGKRAGYFYGTDAFYLNYVAKNSPGTSTDTSNGLIMSFWSVSTSDKYSQRYGYNTTGYGVYPNNFYYNGNIRIAARYNSNYSRTIDGTYKVEVWLLDPAGGVPIFG